jgi:predicted P-loop ATPase
VQEIVSRRIDLTESYEQWLRIGFAIADKFGEGGRGYFHQVSQFNSSYSTRVCDKQYSNCLKAKKSGITIATFYFLAKQAGITTVSATTRLVATTAHFAKKGSRTRESAVQYLQDAEGIPASQSVPIIDQVFDSNIYIDTKESPIEAVEMWLRQNYDLRRNVITRYIENRGKPVQTKDLNSIFIAGKKVFEKLTFDILEKIIFSDFTPDFNPLLDFFSTHQARRPKGIIRLLFDTIESDTGMVGGEFFPQYKEYFGTRWLVGLISSAHGVHSPLLLVLSGKKQGTGKTEFFRRILPKELHKYYAESKLDKDKDDEILMTQKWIIMDDELGGKNKKETSRLKELTSKQTFSLREPYGRNNVDLQRLAVLCGTTNSNEILNDPSGNRRIIPINVLSVNHAAYNAIDKIDLIMEAYWLWKDGFNWELSSEDVHVLNENTSNFQEPSPEMELLLKHFEKPETDSEAGFTEFLSTTEIKSILEINSHQKLSTAKLGQELQRMGWIRHTKRRDKVLMHGYFVRNKAKVTSVASMLPV